MDSKNFQIGQLVQVEEFNHMDNLVRAFERERDLNYNTK